MKRESKSARGELPTEAGFAGSPAAGAVLGALWLLLPAVQYAGAYQRTQATIGEAASAGALGGLDLSPWYVLLIGMTVAYAVLAALSRRQPVAARSSPE